MSATVAQSIATAQRHESEGRLAAAEAAYLNALAAAPAQPDVLRALALIAHRRGQAMAARRYIERSIAAQPRAETYLILAGLCTAQQQHGPAIAACEQAASLAPADPAPWMEMAGIHAAARDFPAAETALRQALQRQPGLPAAWLNLGAVLFSQGRFEAAVETTKSLLAVHPGQAVAWKNLGAAERALGNFAAAREAYLTAIRHAPDYAEAHRDLGLLDLQLGNAKAGFAAYEWRWRAPEIGAPLFPTPRWGGTGNVSGKTILLQWEQGFGDTIQCLRFVPLVAAQFKNVILRVPRPLQLLASQFSNCARVVPDTEPPPRHDMHAYLFSLPHLLGTYGPTAPEGAPYLSPPAARVAAWRSLLAGVPGKKIGIAWVGNPQQINNQHRSIPAETLAPYLALPGCTVFSLLPGLPPPAGVQPLPAPLANFAETAAVMANLDLVISTDTATAHLAGALGRPVWVLLNAVPDWRWGLTGDTTPWYQSARLYRQTSPGDWTSVLTPVRAQLEHWIGEEESSFL